MSRSWGGSWDRHQKGTCSRPSGRSLEGDNVLGLDGHSHPRRLANLKVGHLLYTYLMESVMVTAVLNTQVTRADVDQLVRMQG